MRVAGIRRVDWSSLPLTLSNLRMDIQGSKKQRRKNAEFQFFLLLSDRHFPFIIFMNQHGNEGLIRDAFFNGFCPDFH